MKQEVAEIFVGIFVVIGFVCIGWMTVKLGKLDVFEKNEYTLKAEFNSITGLKKYAQVEISGIQVGRVTGMELDVDNQVAVVELRIRNEIKLGDDVIASVKTSGLIGDKYIKLSLGGSEDYLEDTDYITETESTIDLEELISKYVFGGID